MLDDFKVKFCDTEFDCVDKGFDKNEDIEVVIRPEDIKMVSPQEGMNDSMLPGMEGKN